MFEVSAAKGCFLYDHQNNAYLDLVAGFGVNNIGHGVEEVLAAINAQAGKYLHTSVYGEHVQTPQIAYAELLKKFLPASLHQFYYLSSGSECVDAAIKLGRAYTGRTEIVVCNNAYHGSTVGAESIRSDLEHKRHFLPLLPGVRFIRFNDWGDLEKITAKAALVITEVVQAEAGVIPADPDWLRSLRQRCTECGALLAFDEIQTGFGRTGKIFAFEHYGIAPDVLLLGKAMGGGLPLAAVVSSRDIMRAFGLEHPLAYISTFGGNPVSCAAGMAAFQYLITEQLPNQAAEKAGALSALFSKDPGIDGVRYLGLMMALDLPKGVGLWTVIQKLYEEKILVEGYLFSPQSLRVTPPLNTPLPVLMEAAERIMHTIKNVL